MNTMTYAALEENVLDATMIILYPFSSKFRFELVFKFTVSMALVSGVKAFHAMALLYIILLVNNVLFGRTIPSQYLVGLPSVCSRISRNVVYSRFFSLISGEIIIYGEKIKIGLRHSQASKRSKPVSKGSYISGK